MGWRCSVLAENLSPVQPELPKELPFCKTNYLRISFDQHTLIIYKIQWDINQLFYPSSFPEINIFGSNLQHISLTRLTSCSQMLIDSKWKKLLQVTRKDEELTVLSNIFQFILQNYKTVSGNFLSNSPLICMGVCRWDIYVCKMAKEKWQLTLEQDASNQIFYAVYICSFDQALLFSYSTYSVGSKYF